MSFSGRSASLLSGKSLLERIRRRVLTQLTRCKPAYNTYNTQRLRSVDLRRGVRFQAYSSASYCALFSFSRELERINPAGEVPLWFCAFASHRRFATRTKRAPYAMPGEVPSSRPSKDGAFIVRRLACGLCRVGAIRVPVYQ